MSFKQRKMENYKRMNIFNVIFFTFVLATNLRNTEAACSNGDKEVNPIDCTSYYVCCSGVLVLKSCESGLYYDQDSSQCVPDNGQCIPTPTPDCNDNNTPGESETPTPTPTPGDNETPTPTPTPEDSGDSTPDCNGNNTPTPGDNETPTPTPTPGDNETPTPTPTPGDNETPTPTPTPGDNETPTPTPTPGDNETPTPTPGDNETPTPTPTPGDNETPTPTPTPEDNSTPTPCTEGEKLVNAQDCASYFICTDGKDVLQVCNSGDYFDKSTLECIPDVDDKCTPNGADSECVGIPNNGLVPVEGNCSAFYICLYGKVIQQTCPNNLHFNNVIKRCDYPENAGCEWPSSPPSTGPSGTACDDHGVCLSQPDGTMFAAATNACSSKYIVCQCECEIDFSCDSSLVFNPKIDACDWPDNVEC